MSLLDTDTALERAEIQINIWEHNKDITPNALYIDRYSTLPIITEDMYNGKIIFCNNDLYVLSYNTWQKLNQ